MREDSKVRDVRVTPRLTWLFGAAACGLVIIGIARPQSMTGLVTVAAACIAAVVALSINETVDDRRRRELRAAEDERAAEAQRFECDLEMRLLGERDAVYQEVMKHLLAAFEGGSSAQESTIRSRVVTWGSARFIDSYRAFRKEVAQLLPSGSSGMVEIPEERRDRLRNLLADVAIAARQDLRIEPGASPTRQAVVESLFDGASGSQSS